ncbi:MULTISPECIES: ABC transporter permease [unclassified Sphingomonas]|uniref:cell division protein FtsX n=1 Tax=unclassified Sphingomonas TaxID=196159 RepID=UPI000BD871C1|nr:MAG: permease [Sphingomonas sp. 12-62-6]OYX38731.1 MAG: permease [Sphingomonas sp. 32-62-10]
MKIRLITPAADRRLLDESRRTRSMIWIMAIMLFLTVLAAAFGLGTLAAANVLDRQIAGRVTVQIVEANEGARERDAAAALRLIRQTPGVARAEPVDRAQLAGLLRPWLGEDGADPDLPMPAMIDVELLAGTDSAVARLARAVRAVVPSARIDRHESWMSPVSNFMQLMIWLAAGLVVLMAGATAAVVILVGRAGLDTHRETIEVLHMLGSTDMQVARLFQRRIALDTLYGGAAGTVLAMLTIGLVGSQLSGLGSDLVSGIALSERDWVLLAGLPILFALLATVAARYAVLGALRQFL